MEKIPFVDSASLLQDIITYSVMSYIIAKYCGRDVGWRQGKEAYRKSPIWYIIFFKCEIISKNLYTQEGTVISKALALKNLHWQFLSERNWTQQKCFLLVSSLYYLCHERAISPWLWSQWISKYIEQGSKPQKTRALKTVVVICPQGEIQTVIHRDSDDFRYLDCQPAVNVQSPLEPFIKINCGCQFDVPAYVQSLKYKLFISTMIFRVFLEDVPILTRLDEIWNVWTTQTVLMWTNFQKVSRWLSQWHFQLSYMAG